MLWIVIKPLLFVVCFVFGCARLLAQKPGSSYYHRLREKFGRLA